MGGRDTVSRIRQSRSDFSRRDFFSSVRSPVGCTHGGSSQCRKSEGAVRTIVRRLIPWWDANAGAHPRRTSAAGSRSASVATPRGGAPSDPSHSDGKASARRCQSRHTERAAAPGAPPSPTEARSRPTAYHRRRARTPQCVDTRRRLPPGAVDAGQRVQTCRSHAGPRTSRSAAGAAGAHCERSGKQTHETVSLVRKEEDAAMQAPRQSIVRARQQVNGVRTSPGGSGWPTLDRGGACRRCGRSSR